MRILKMCSNMRNVEQYLKMNEWIKLYNTFKEYKTKTYGMFMTHPIGHNMIFTLNYCCFFQNNILNRTDSEWMDRIHANNLWHHRHRSWYCLRLKQGLFKLSLFPSTSPCIKDGLWSLWGFASNSTSYRDHKKMYSKGFSEVCIHFKSDASSFGFFF